MSRKPAKALSDEDRILWSRVARSAQPLKGRRAVEEAPAAPMTMGEAMDRIETTPVPAHPARPRQTVAHSFDAPTHDKLAKGRLPIEGRVDLHGLTQAEAYSLLLSFLHRAHAGGVRYVLVITGKGSSSGGEGVLRRTVPVWLATAPFRALVSSHDHAARNHGGAGALYVRLRRHAARRS
ncbi:Smr/MutS family protein [Pseudaminobacter sp. NGMCC 1.201702]|uniref:Smr/MutS family protein n=1 Tax=Pseudaminobacter sp. NGMCC 1.201702 TaxID=3391825 RepID=UPI0039EFA28E